MPDIDIDLTSVDVDIDVLFPAPVITDVIVDKIGPKGNDGINANIADTINLLQGDGLGSGDDSGIPVPSTYKYITGTGNTTTDTAAIQSAVTALGTSGGVLRIYGPASLNSSSISFPSLTNTLNIELYGSLTLSTSLILPNNVNLVGLGGANNSQFQRSGPTAKIVPPSGNIPTIIIRGGNTKLVKNITINSNQGVGILFDGPGGGGNAMVQLENVACVPSDVSTGYPVVIDTYFWVWIKDCSFLSQPTNPFSIYITQTTNGGASSGLIHISDSVIAGKGIKIDSQVSTSHVGNIVIRNVVYESCRNSYLTLDGINGKVSGIYLDHVELADQIVSPLAFITIDNGPVSNISITNSYSVLSNVGGLVSGGNIDGLYVDSGRENHYSTGWTLGDSQRDYTLIGAGTIDSALVNRGASLSPSIIPFASLNVNQDCSAWSGLSGSAVVTTGVMAPDGSTTAATLSSASGEQQRTVYRVGGYSLAAGDWVIAGVWMRATTSTGQTYSASNLATNPGGTFDAPLTLNDDAAEQVGCPWRQVVRASKVTVASGSYEIIYNLKCDPTHPTSYWKPWAIYIPNGTTTDEEIIRWYRTLSNVVSNKAAGTVAMYPNQTLDIGTLNISQGGSTTISTGVGSVKMSSTNAATNSAWIPVKYAGTTYFVPGFTTNSP